MEKSVGICWPVKTGQRKEKYVRNTATGVDLDLFVWESITQPRTRDGGERALVYPLCVARYKWIRDW